MRTESKTDRTGMPRRLAASLLCAALLPAAPAVLADDADDAAGARDALDAVRACRAEHDDTRRLACFDRAAAALPADAKLSAAPAPAAPPPPQLTPEERFGYRGQVAREELDRRKAEEAALEELTARITRVGAQGSGDFVITLDNGQVWAQVPTGRPERLKVDETVTIRRASLGSYMLSAPHARGIRVRRVK